MENYSQILQNVSKTLQSLMDKNINNLENFEYLELMTTMDSFQFITALSTTIESEDDKKVIASTNFHAGKLESDFIISKIIENERALYLTNKEIHIIIVS
jgi:hypothetical protein